MCKYERNEDQARLPGKGSSQLRCSGMVLCFLALVSQKQNPRENHTPGKFQCPTVGLGSRAQEGLPTTLLPGFWAELVASRGLVLDHIWLLVSLRSRF